MSDDNLWENGSGARNMAKRLRSLRSLPFAITISCEARKYRSQFPPTLPPFNYAISPCILLLISEGKLLEIMEKVRRLFKNSTETVQSPAAQPALILDLPRELILQIFSHLSYNEIIQCRKTCWRFNQIAESSATKLERPSIRVDFTPGVNEGVPTVWAKFCRTNSKLGAPYIFGLCQLEGRVELYWSTGKGREKITLNGTAESCNSLTKKTRQLPPAQISREFGEEIPTLEEALKRLLRVHLKKAHVKELNFRYQQRPILRSEIDIIRCSLKENNCTVGRVYFGKSDPAYKEIAEFTKCQELSLQADSGGKIDLLELTMPKILIYGDGGITVDLLVTFTEQWESGSRQISEFRWMTELDVAQIKHRLRGLSSFYQEEASRTLLKRSLDSQQIVVNIEHNSLQMYTPGEK